MIKIKTAAAMVKYTFKILFSLFQYWYNKEAITNFATSKEAAITITEEQFTEAVKSLNQVDLSKVIEMSDNTALMDQAACAGGACEVV